MITLLQLSRSRPSIPLLIQIELQGFVIEGLHDSKKGFLGALAHVDHSSPAKFSGQGLYSCTWRLGPDHLDWTGRLWFSKVFFCGPAAHIRWVPVLSAMNEVFLVKKQIPKVKGLYSCCLSGWTADLNGSAGRSENPHNPKRKVLMKVFHMSSLQHSRFAVVFLFVQRSFEYTSTELQS